MHQGQGQGSHRSMFEAGGEEPRPGEWVGIAANAKSGRGSSRGGVGRLVAELGAYGLGARVVWTPEDRAELVRQAAVDPACRCLVAAGGDGTVGALVNDVPSVPITVLPRGTENLFARYFKLGRDPAHLAATIARGSRRRIDLGCARDRRFTLMAGIGLDADVVTRHHLARVGHAGVMRPTSRTAYVEPVLRASLNYRFPTLKVRVEDPGHEEELEGSTAFLFNLPSYALGLPFAPTARADDGLLDLLVFRRAGALQALRYLWMVVCGIHLDSEDVEHRRVGRVTLAADDPVPMQLDGDPCGHVSRASDGNPLRIEALPGVIDVLVPSAFGLSLGETAFAGHSSHPA